MSFSVLFGGQRENDLVYIWYTLDEKKQKTEKKQRSKFKILHESAFVFGQPRMMHLHVNKTNLVASPE